MHICATNPTVCRREEISEEVIEREKKIYLEQIKDKPEAAKEKIIEGKLEKFYKDNVLLEQAYVKDEQYTVEELIKSKIGISKKISHLPVLYVSNRRKANISYSHVYMFIHGNIYFFFSIQ